MNQSFDAKKFLDVYAHAARAKDVDAFMSLYHPDVKVFDTWGEWSYDGAVAWRKVVEAWFGSLGTERVEVGFEDVAVTAGAELASLHAFASYAGVSAEGVRLRAMQNRFTWVLRRDGAAWRVVHEHTSVPVSLDHAKAILQRV